MNYKIMLYLHILAGFLALLCGCISIASKKGGKIHRLSGKIFFFSMLGVCTSAVYISLVKDNAFLLHIGIFSFYLNFAGYRAIKDKSLKAAWLDWVVLFLAVINSFYMVYSMNRILMIFGGLCFYALIQHLRTNILILQKKPLADLAWLKMHIGMMMGAFISTSTAFLVVNMNSLNVMDLPVWFGWLLPTIILLPLSVYYSRKYVAKRVGK